jgi:IS605 OrfB family transposase
LADSQEVVKLAKRFNANIAVEKLRNLRKHRGEWSKNSRKKVNRIPYAPLRHALKSVAEREGTLIKEVSPATQAKPAHGVGT